MSYCSKCGAEMKDDAAVCPSCGAPAAQQPPHDAKQTASGSDFTATVQQLNNTPDTTAEFDQKDIEDNKAMAILAYLSILVLIPLFAAKESKFARYHTNQGFVLFLIEIVWSVVSGVISALLPLIVIRLLFGLVNIALLVLAILGIVNAAGGKAKELPIIGSIHILN